MPLGNRPSLRTIATFFAAGNKLSDFKRGGGIVPNIAANNAISTTNAGLKQSQFSGADVISATIHSGTAGIADFRPQGDINGVFGIIAFTTGGRVMGGNSQEASYDQGGWMTGGPSSDYEIYLARVSGTVAAYFTTDTRARLDVWNSMNTDLIINTLTYTNQITISAQLTATIRKKGTTAVLGTWNIAIDLSVGTPI